MAGSRALYSRSPTRSPSGDGKALAGQGFKRTAKASTTRTSPCAGRSGAQSACTLSQPWRSHSAPRRSCPPAPPSPPTAPSYARPPLLPSKSYQHLAPRRSSGGGALAFSARSRRLWRLPKCPTLPPTAPRPGASPLIFLVFSVFPAYLRVSPLFVL